MNADLKSPADVSPSVRILLVEDSPEVRETTVEFIEELGHAVEAVETAEAALDALADRRFDLVMTDISLPGMSGVQLVKKIRETDPSQRIVIVSGYGDDYKDHDFGAPVGVLAKPYDLATLERVIAGNS